MTRTIPFLVASLFTVLCGFAHGLRTDRWVVSRELQDAAARLAKVPAAFGDWEGLDQKIDGRELEAAGIVGYVMRRYENRRNGAALTVLLVCGRPGRISVHTPDVCYAGAGYVAAQSPERLPLNPGPTRPTAEVMWADFVKEKASVPAQLRIFWAWSTGGPWKAPENPRLAHASHRALYKIYTIRETAGPAGPVDGDPGVAFLKEFLPVLEGTLAPAPARP